MAQTGQGEVVPQTVSDAAVKMAEEPIVKQTVQNMQNAQTAQTAQTAEQSQEKGAAQTKSGQESQGPSRQADTSGQTVKQHVTEQPKGGHHEARQVEVKEAKQEASPFVKPEQAHSPDKVYVKVSEGGTLKQEQFASQLSDKIMQNMSQGKQQFIIQLMPQDLGQIMIKMVIQNGKVDLMMQCANPKTQQLVMMSAEAIRNIVEQGTGMQTTLNAKEENELAYRDSDEQGGKNGEEKNSKEQDEQSEMELDTFLHQLRLGLTEEPELTLTV